MKGGRTIGIPEAGVRGAKFPRPQSHFPPEFLDGSRVVTPERVGDVIGALYVGNDKVTPQHARSAYGVVLDASGSSVDHAQTERLRAELRRTTLQLNGPGIDAGTP